MNRRHSGKYSPFDASDPTPRTAGPLVNRDLTWDNSQITELCANVLSAVAMAKGCHGGHAPK